MKDVKVLVTIPARAGSKRIPGKNIKDFLGRSLIEYAIEQALQLTFVDRVIVDTDSQEISDIAKKAGAEVPWLRPKHLASDTAQIVDSIIYTLDRLEKDESYIPTHIMILQTTSPLREIGDINKAWAMLQNTNATTVLSVCETHPRLYHLSSENDLLLINGSEKQSTNMQAWEKGYILNGCFVYIVNVKALRNEKTVITKKTKAIICPKWRSIDLDTPEEWVLAEVLYKNKKMIESRIKEMQAFRHRSPLPVNDSE